MENTLLTRIQLKYDTLDNWILSSQGEHPFILKSGEIAIATIANVNTINRQVNLASPPENTPPAIGMKVGDGTHTFTQLPWIQAVAGDVYEWAKQPLPPAASQIPGLTSFIQQVSGGGGGGTGTSMQYRIQYSTDNNTNVYTLQSSVDGVVWNDVLNSNINLTDFVTLLRSLEQWAKNGNSTLKSLSNQISDYVVSYMGELYYNDSAEQNTVVTRVTQEDGLINVTHTALTASNITGGKFSVPRGGTGLDAVPANTVLVGTGSDSLNTRPIDSEVNNGTSNNLVTSGAVYNYVNSRIGNLTGAMRFVGVAVQPINLTPDGNKNPNISGMTYPTSYRDGDVVISGAAEYVWTNGGWALLGDESSYAVRGTITDEDIMDGAAIAQSKIQGTSGNGNGTLADDLAGKVNVEQGKGLSTNDFTDTDKTKLDNIANGAQVNLIEHINLAVTQNGETTTTSQAISASTKTATISLDLSNVGQVNGAKVPSVTGLTTEDIPIDSNDKKLQLNRIAKTGDVADLVQEQNSLGEITILVFDCGSSTRVVDDGN